MPTYPLDPGIAAVDAFPMFVRCKRRFKDGKEHRYWSVVESCRLRGGRVVQRQVLYLGEINDSQRAAWCRSIEVVEGKSGSRQMALFPEDREAPALNCEVVKINVSEVALHEPRQWGACWLALSLWDRLDLDRFWGERLPPSRQGTRWLDVLKILVCYRLIDPGSEWRLHRHWYEHSALRDLLGCERVVAGDTLYRCLDRLLAHKQDFFSFLRARWAALFEARFDVLLYDLTSTYFESDPPHPDKRRFGYSRDRRADCVQVVIALIVTPEGFPLAYEVMPGNTAEQTTLADFLEKIERQYGRSERIWIMDRGIPTEETLAAMRKGAAPLRYLVGTPKGRLTRLEAAFLDRPWQEVRRSVDVKLLVEDGGDVGKRAEPHVAACPVDGPAPDPVLRDGLELARFVDSESQTVLVAVDAGAVDASDECGGQAALVGGFDGGLRGNRTLVFHAIVSPIDSPTASEYRWKRVETQGPIVRPNRLI